MDWIIKKGEGGRREVEFISGSRSEEGLFGPRIKHSETRRSRGGESGIIRGIALLLPCSVANTIISKPENEIAEHGSDQHLIMYVFLIAYRFSGHNSTYSNHSSKSFRPRGGRCFLSSTSSRRTSKRGVTPKERTFPMAGGG